MSSLTMKTESYAEDIFKAVFTIKVSASSTAYWTEKSDSSNFVLSMAIRRFLLLSLTSNLACMYVEIIVSLKSTSSEACFRARRSRSALFVFKFVK